MFKINEEERKRMYKVIYNNLRITSLEVGVSKLRRLEIRFLPLDPLLICYLFKAMRHNCTLQELILTDDSLQYCNQELFSILFDAIELNQYSSLTLLDLSRNIHTFDITEAVHLDLLDALCRQRRKSILDERASRSEAEGGE